MTFLDNIKQGCLDGWTKYKILPSLTAAQAILESGWGKYAPHNALFGIKADSSWTGKSFNTKTQEEYQAGVMTDIVDRFRAYDSWTDSIVDHGKFLNDNPRYKAVIGETDYKKACYAIKDAGYATASGYAELLIQLIEENNLQSWDAETIKNKEETMTTANEIVKYCVDLANSGMGVDKDGCFGTQCADLPCFVAKNWFGVDLWGNAIDLLNSAAGNGWEVHRMPTDANPKAGAVFVMHSIAYDGVDYGHTGVVIADSDGYTMRTVEQNIDGNADALIVGGPARFNTRGFVGVAGWFYPPYKDTKVKQPIATETKDEINLIKEIGTFTVDADVINVRRAPNLKSDVVATYKKGQSVTYDSKGSANGYRWISYVGGSGKRNYMAIGQTDASGNRISLWGMIK
ncbi:glucosaminidase domain-containing protein [Streptococcus agalactiae]|uniref:N-acetylmuramoyl-L-alanine amidase n=1 Tax=Streptococcus agalactiae TaxID=1311 RepID=A0A837KZA2_STRAG|nr:glucosaminidase domain-containing protein [Streptococcus agalactiae]EPT39049.1 lysin [Streptococcus agalactiae FSL S3-603]EPV89883.1 lysin [Streptococcus agalactiae FSL S3-105]KLL39294.1 lysin [Streptococcus agalactiae]MCQ3826167.1 glucosaminidase domain-containing protein [Streptococcus agalactiae]SUN26104.1 lysin [Streptococcus agalactiae]